MGIAREITHTLRVYLGEGRVYMDSFGWMYLDEELANQLDFSSWPDVELRQIEIRDLPLDGQRLPGDP